MDKGGALRLRRDLDTAPAARAWPVGFTHRTFLPADAPEVHALLRLAYTEGCGVADYDEWWDKLSNDSQFDPVLCFLVFDGAGRLAGVAQCWTSAFLKDLAVHAETRRLGIGENLLRLAFATFRALGAPSLDLKVEADNASAIRLYERAGMRRVPLAG